MPQHVYKTIHGRDLQLTVWPCTSGLAAPLPGIVFFHGGGWRTGSPMQFQHHATHLAARGMVAISVQYRLIVEEGVSPIESLQDARSAMRYVRNHAASLGIDPARLAAAGGSAGGHLAAATAFCPGFDEPGEDLSTSCRPQALVLFNPVVDISPQSVSRKRLEQWQEAYPRFVNEWEVFSPQQHVAPDGPPTLFMLGDSDQLIPVDSAHRFKQVMDEAGNRCDLKIYPGAGHGFFNRGSKSSDGQAGVSPWFEPTMRAMDDFFVSLGWLKPAAPDAPLLIDLD